MDVLTSQQITTYYERYKKAEIVFTKEIIEAAGLVTGQVFLKCSGELWNCIIYSFSFESVKIVVSKKAGLIQKLQDSHNFGKLNLAFANPNAKAPIAISVTSKVAGYTPYKNSDDMIFLSLHFTNRPPDDLIVIMGRILEAHVNSALSYQKQKRIPLTVENMRELNISSREVSISIQGVSRQCILNDISFSGAQIAIIGIAKFLEDREVLLTLEFDNPKKSYSIRGRFVGSQAVEGQKEWVAMRISFDEALIPIGYKLRINDYIGDLK
jgi:hypothetical protein